MRFTDLLARVRPYFCVGAQGLFMISALVIVAACQDGGEQASPDNQASNGDGPDTEITEAAPTETEDSVGSDPGDADNGMSTDDDDDSDMPADTDNDMSTDGDGDNDMATDQPTSTMDDDGMNDDSMDEGDMDDSMMGLGGTSQSDVLAEGLIEHTVDGPLGWVAFEYVADGESESTISVENPGFVYAVEGMHTVTVEGQESMLQPEEALFIPDGSEYRHEGDGRIWDIRLTDPSADTPEGISGDPVFSSGELEEVPDERARMHFVEVELSPGGETSIHTHPGPEYIYVTQGEIIYENELVDPQTMQPGDDHSMPPDTAVQKRNTTEDTAVFLSWFVVDPDRPFAPEADFH